MVSRRSLLRGAAIGAGVAAAELSTRAIATAQVAAPGQAPGGAQAAAPDYSIWYLEYANAPNFAVSGMLYGAHNQGTIRVPFGYVAVKGMGAVALFDVGYRTVARGGELGRLFGVTDWEPPETVLGKVGLAPSDVTHVFIGHGHFDHMDNLPAFPNAQIYLQERELTEWMSAMQVPAELGWITGAVNPQDLMDAAQASLEQRLTLVDGQMLDVLPGISIHPAWDTHTFGTQYVTVQTSGGPFLLAGDAIYWYGNVEGAPKYGLAQGVYVPLGYGQGNQVTQLEKMREMVDRVGRDTTRIVPGHDPAIFDRYPSRQVGPNSVAEVHLAAGEPSRVA